MGRQVYLLFGVRASGLSGQPIRDASDRLTSCLVGIGLERWSIPDASDRLAFCLVGIGAEGVAVSRCPQHLLIKLEYFFECFSYAVSFYHFPYELFECRFIIRIVVLKFSDEFLYTSLIISSAI